MDIGKLVFYYSGEKAETVRIKEIMVVRVIDRDNVESELLAPIEIQILRNNGTVAQKQDNEDRGDVDVGNALGTTGLNYVDVDLAGPLNGVSDAQSPMVWLMIIGTPLLAVGVVGLMIMKKRRRFA